MKQVRIRLERLERAKRSAVAGVDCICFPPDEPPALIPKVEVEAARAVHCPLHAARFSKLAPSIYTARQFIRLAHLQPESWLDLHSRQYVEALRASISSDRWLKMTS